MSKVISLSLTSSSPGPFSLASDGREKVLASAGHMTNKHPNNFFSIKANHCVFELSVRCVCLFHCAIATEFDYRIQYNRFRVVLHTVDSLNVKHELRSKKISNSVSCRHFQTIFLGLALENRVLLFA